MFGKYKVAHLLGITREHEKQFRSVETELTKKGYICFAPVIYSLDVYNQYPDLLDDMCYEKLLVCDFCVLVTPEHIGKSTRNRIKQAVRLGKPVYVYEDGELKDFDVSSLYIKVDIYHYNREVVGEKIIYDSTPTYMGYAEVDVFNAQEILTLCNWMHWTKDKPLNLHADIGSCDHGLLLINPETQERWLSKSIGWLVGSSYDIDKYVSDNKYSYIWM